ncbi:MAG: DNA translocase FtsK [Paracoccaceae bacterium]
MASYQARRRDPLLDQNVQAALERRGKELLGLTLIGLGVLLSLMLASYSPEDPGWFAAAEQAVHNRFGRIGASIASPLMVIVGRGSWVLVLALLVWGGRFLLHRGEDRAFPRAIFVPIAIAVASAYATTLPTPADWGHSFGLGGLFGETLVGAILNVLPFSFAFGLKLLSVLLAFGMLALGAFALGFNRRELRAIGRFMIVGLIVTYSRMLDWLSTGARGTARAAQAMNDRRAERRGVATEAQGYETSFGKARAADGAAAERGGLLSRLPSLVRRPPAADPVAELIEPALSRTAMGAEAPSEARIRSRIADVIRQRGTVEPGAPRSEPPVMRGQAPGGTVFRHAARDTEIHNAFVDDALPDDEDDDVLPIGLSHDDSIDDMPARRVVQAVSRRPVAPSKRAMAEAQPRLGLGDAEGSAYEPPPLSLLTNPADVKRHVHSSDALEENARMLESVLDDYGVKGEIMSVRPGPVVTMYELEPAPGLKASRVIGLADDIARSMEAHAARVATVPGRNVIGIELPNEQREKVVLREILAARDFGDSNMRLPLALGKDIAGEPVVANLAKMPHLLIAGTTGSGKSVAINTMILSLLYKLSPEECRLIMIDPKMLELSVYDGIPHLLSPVVTDPKKAVVALKWVVGEMEERYRKMSKMGVRNIEGYNGRVREALAKSEMFKRTVQTGFDEDTGEPVFETEEFAPQSIPYIVVIVDEMADLMMVAGKEIEACIQRLAQMARASGIHLIMATQRPSVDVITGTIKANFPTRISFQVTSKIDSRTILGEQGAEQLLGMGDMLYMAGGAKITRIHGPFVSDEEVEEIVTHLKSFGPPVYMSGVVEGPDEDAASDIDAVLGLGGNTDGEDALYDQAVAVVLKDRKVSTSYIQRKLGVGYNKAAKLVEQMEEQGVVSSANHVGKREILVPE